MPVRCRAVIDAHGGAASFWLLYWIVLNVSCSHSTDIAYCYVFKWIKLLTKIYKTVLNEVREFNSGDITAINGNVRRYWSKFQ